MTQKKALPQLYPLMILFLAILFLGTKTYAQDAAATQKPTHIILIRHGETIRSRACETIQGWLNDAQSHLTPQGVEEAREVGKNLAKLYQGQIAILYTSPLERAIQTAKEIAAQLNVPIYENRRFIEKCHGQHDGMNTKERNAFAHKMDQIREEAFRAQYPDTPFPRFFRWEYDALSEREIPLERILNPYEGELEPLLAVYQRGLEALRDLANNHPGEVVPVVTHWVLMDTLAQGILSEGSEEMLFRYYDAKVPGDRRLSFPKHGSAYHFNVYPDGRITFEGVENL